MQIEQSPKIPEIQKDESNNAEEENDEPNNAEREKCRRKKNARERKTSEIMEIYWRSEKNKGDSRRREEVRLDRKNNKRERERERERAI
ncbi:hypothetical protein TorRG33x02_183810 [Trema orientale]|uniref:Uncharacterized protein n=1 Tax=Trema orientale TaxID=63057 RepID=A0A2P5EJV7_TREOI|nr:hypothetical protein TorRG33x02_183810 [Trema orientale]